MRLKKIKDKIDKKIFMFKETNKDEMKRAIYISDLYEILNNETKPKEEEENTRKA